MKSKQILYLALAAVVLLVIYVFTQSRSIPKAEMKMFVAVDTAKVEEVVIYHDGTTTNLNRTDKGWEITNPFEYKANKSFINTMLKKFMDMRIESRITDKKARWPEFEVHDELATKVTLVQDGNRSDFYIGKASSGYQQTYARLEGEDTVYLIKGTFGVAINRQPEAWREKKVSDMEVDQMLKITTDNLALEKEGMDWRVTTKDGESFVADQTKADRMAKSLQNLRTSDFPEQKDFEMIDWDKPSNEALVELTTGDSRRIRLYPDPNDDNRYFMRYHDHETVFRVYKGMVGQMFKEKDDLKPKEAEEE